LFLPVRGLAVIEDRLRNDLMCRAGGKTILSIIPL